MVFAQEVISAVAKVCDWQETGLSDHALCVLEDFHTSTWFWMELLDDIVVTYRGCTAGNPIADLIYIASDACLERRLREALRVDGLVFSISDEDAMPYFGIHEVPAVHDLSRIAYVDDGVIPILAPASLIAARVRQTASIAQKYYEEFGFALNFVPGKSADVLAFAGTGAQQARKQIFVEDQGLVHCLSGGGQSFVLRVVPRYKHLGGYIVASGDVTQEIGPKMAMVRNTSRQLHRPFLRDPEVAPGKKAQVMQSLILSRGLHLASCWPILSSRKTKALQRAVVDMLHPLLGQKDVRERISDDEVITRLGVLHPLRLPTLMRSNLAIRIANQAPPQILVLLLFAARASSRSWLRALEADFDHLATSSVLSEFVGKPVAAWFAFFREHAGQAKKVVLKAVCNSNWISVVERVHIREFSTYCTLCGEAAVDRQALSVHMCRAHGVRRFVWAYVDGLTCLVCGLMFASHQRLIENHIAEKSAVCMHNYFLRYKPFPPSASRGARPRGTP